MIKFKINNYQELSSKKMRLGTRKFGIYAIFSQLTVKDGKGNKNDEIKCFFFLNASWWASLQKTIKKAGNELFLAIESSRRDLWGKEINNRRVFQRWRKKMGKLLDDGVGRGVGAEISGKMMLIGWQRKTLRGVTSAIWTGNRDVPRLFQTAQRIRSNMQPLQSTVYRASPTFYI